MYIVYIMYLTYIVYKIYTMYMIQDSNPFGSISIYHDRRIKLNTMRMVNGKIKMHPDSVEWLEKEINKMNGINFARKFGNTLAVKNLVVGLEFSKKPIISISGVK